VVMVSRRFQPCFWAVASRVRMMAKSVAPARERKLPEIFWRSFIMRASRSASLLVNGTAGSARKRSTSDLRVEEAQQQVVADAPWRRAAAALAGGGGWRLGLVEGEA